MAQYSCTYCQNPVVTCRIQCVECTDFDLCLQASHCFACAVEAGPHRKEHDYRVLDDGTFNVFDTKGSVVWATVEEEMLLDAVEQFGFGNWEDVANHVKSKTSTDCQQHYYAFYLHGSIGQATFTSEPTKRVIDHTCPNGGPLSPSLSTSSSAPDITPLEQHELGYMPLRDDFEREYDNGAESLVSGLSINYDDEDLDIAFKLAQVDIYRQRLKERQRRKKIARDFSIIQNSTSVGVKRLQANKKKQSKDDREFQDRMRVFAQFHAPKEHEQLFDNIHKERKLKHRIKDLMKYRKNGITKFNDCADFETEKQNRDKKKDKKVASSGNVSKRSSLGSKKENDEDVNIIIGDMKKNGVKHHPATTAETGGELLSEREKKLCTTIGMKPACYITVKTCIIKDYLQRRHGVPIKIRYPSHLDKTHRRRILNFLSENGWIGNVAAF
ncbi:hypothetical protein CAPTEDRAFT_172520 [Capitella teleta]|uniref:Transcriptional adapter n=1 Tax=Capitella teleta TaxID=283909 RepID=R7U721_CAPTE|nr:hypothetical protein CAPTEDRAFT_172520 [Capitella teleta]|eukprot:ELT99466.1 hypothetical protein CAPTEDRAFT_172520 [Capitella teleta]